MHILPLFRRGLRPIYSTSLGGNCPLFFEQFNYFSCLVDCHVSGVGLEHQSCGMSFFRPRLLFLGV